MSPSSGCPLRWRLGSEREETQGLLNVGPELAAISRPVLSTGGQSQPRFPGGAGEATSPMGGAAIWYQGARPRERPRIEDMFAACTTTPVYGSFLFIYE